MLHTIIHCKSLHHTATDCSRLQEISSLQCTATHCKYVYIYINKARAHHRLRNTLQHTTSHCNTTLQHNTRNLICTTHCDTLRVCIYEETACASVPLPHTATHRNTLQHTATHCAYVYMKKLHAYHYRSNKLQHTSTHCNTLQHTATHCSTLRMYE